MENLLQFLKAGYSIIVLDCGKCAIGKFSDEIGDGYFDETNGIIDGCLVDLEMVYSVKPPIKLIDDRVQYEYF